MLIGYARDSMDNQNLCLQKDAPLEAGCERIFEDRLSGAKAAAHGAGSGQVGLGRETVRRKAAHHRPDL